MVAVFRHPVDALAAAAHAAPSADAPYEVQRQWEHRFADFLVTKHGLAEALHSDQVWLECPHNEFVERLPPVLDQLLTAPVSAGCTRADVRVYDFTLAIGNLCTGVETFPGYHARRMIDLLPAGPHRPPAPCRRIAASDWSAPLRPGPRCQTRADVRLPDLVVAVAARCIGAGTFPRTSTPATWSMCPSRDVRTAP
ncbi:hypothetical protein ACIP69_38010 [Streptomyces hygroscopicus]|uniref:hypothetical protein n=1 Tax=Streptomyces hygroscopicus TaxID=1912 RepID=UPI00381CFD31